MNKDQWIAKAKESLTHTFYEQQSAEEQDEGFDTTLAFGTAGIRGKFGLGEGRLNKFTVNKVAIGLSRFLLKQHKTPSAVIHYDTRHLSPEFAQIIANVLASHDITVYLSDTYRTTPDLSYAVRYLEADAGVMITASHNPKDYNGIKVYGADGGQLSTEPSNKLSNIIAQLGDPLSLNTYEDIGNKTENIYAVPTEVRNHYFNDVQRLVGNIPSSDLKVVFTSLHGTSVPVVPNILDELHFTNYKLVEAQCQPDAEFSSVTSANPEDHKAFDQAVSLAQETNANLLICTDPDADRLGIAERDEAGHIHYYNGNQIGALLLNYRIKQTAKMTNRLMIQSIVSSELNVRLAQHNHINTRQVLTGFKYIAQEIRQLPADEHFIFGYEESYGYLAGDFVRDKDAVQIVPLIIKYASQLKNEGKMLKDVLNQIYETVGYHHDKLFSHTFEGTAGKQKIHALMTTFRQHTPHHISGLKVTAIEDFEKGEKINLVSQTISPITLPTANVIKIYFNEGFIALRPSGTEPKIKLYVSLSVDHFEQTAQAINQAVFK
ncbi:MAG: phospho-sugar mutase [Staphylococcus lugdunensis]|nr:phospho-sugar mutase [Staphylococcus lugdunensis]